MPLTKTGKQVKKKMQEEYGKEKGEAVFFASIRKGKKGSEKWHKGGKTILTGRREG